MSGARNKLVLAGTIAALGFGSLAGAGVAQARHGADDPVGHDVGDDHGSTARRGADDKPGDDRRRHRARAARHGRDDGPRHDAGDDHGSR